MLCERSGELVFGGQEAPIYKHEKWGLRPLTGGFGDLYFP
jgi:hypothetical protein